MKKICFFVADITASGGTERVGTIVANRLSENENYEICFVSLVEKIDHPFFEISQNVKRYSLFDKPIRGLTNIHRICYRLTKLIKQEKFDVIVDIDGILDMYSLIVKLFTAVKVVSWEHFNFYQHPTVGHRKYTRWLAGRFADTIITLTEEDKEYYLQNLKIKCPIYNIYNPIVGMDTINKYDKSAKVILSVGRLTDQKGFDMLVEVAKEVLYQHPDWKWIILGEGEDRKFLEQKIKEYKLENSLILHGNVSNVEEFYKKTAIFVMTSRYEGLPMVLLETKPYQLPAISFDIRTGPRECIIDGVNGYLVEPFNKSEMAKRINRLIENNQLRISFSEQAMKDTKKFSLDRIIKQWTNLLDEL